MTDDTRPCIVWDMDDTLLDLRTHMQLALYLETNKNIHWSQWTDWNLGEKFGLSSDEIFNALIRHRVIEKATPDIGVKSLFQKTSEMGYQNVILTARSWHPDGEALTRSCLETGGIPFDRLHLIHPGEDKATALRKFNSVVAFVDDHPDHVINASNDRHAKHVFLMDRPWNQGVQHGKRIQALSEVVDFIQLKMAPLVGIAVCPTPT